jgi:hypothetical protein
MIPISYELITDLTFTLDTDNQEAFVLVNGTLSHGALSIQILDPGAQVVVQSSLVSTELLKDPNLQYTDCLWEYIKVAGVEIPIVSTDIASATFWCPTVFFFRNVSGSNLRVKIDLRGSR